MAEINISVNTESKEVVVSVDGKKISDVYDVCIYTEKSGYFGVDIKTLEQMDNLTKIMHLVAKDQKKKPNGQKIGLAKCGLEEWEETESKISNKEDMADLIAQSMGIKLDD